MSLACNLKVYKLLLQENKTFNGSIKLLVSKAKSSKEESNFMQTY